MSDESASVKISIPKTEGDVEMNSNQRRARVYQPLSTDEIATHTNGRDSISEKLRGATFPEG